MYRKDNPYQLTFEDFYLPFGGHFRGDNRGIILANQIPWDRIAAEGKFGWGKQRFSLDRVMTKLAHTSEVSIRIPFLVMNLEKILTGILSFVLFVWRWLLARLQPDTLGYENHIQAGLTTAA